MYNIAQKLCVKYHTSRLSYVECHERNSKCRLQHCICVHQSNHSPTKARGIQDSMCNITLKLRARYGVHICITHPHSKPSCYVVHRVQRLTPASGGIEAGRRMEMMKMSVVTDSPCTVTYINEKNKQFNQKLARFCCK